MWWHLPGSCLKCGSKTDATIHTFFVVDVSAMPKRCLIAVVKSHLKAATDCMSSSLDSRWLFMRLHSMGYSINADGVVSLHMSEVATCSGWSTGSRSLINCQCSSFSSSVFASDGLTTFLSLRTAHTGQHSSTRRSNISYTEFHLVLQCWISFFGALSGTIDSWCLNNSPIATGLCVKWPSKRAAAETHLAMGWLVTLSVPVLILIQSWSLYAAQFTSSQLFLWC